MTDGEPVVYMIGKVKSVFEYQTGEKKDGEPWTVQTLILSDPNDPDEKITVKVWDKDEIPEKKIKGRIVHIYAKHGDKGFSGVYIKEDSYKGKTSTQLRLTATGTLSLEAPEFADSGDQGDDVNDSDDDAPEGAEPPPKEKRTQKEKERDERRAEPPPQEHKEPPPTSQRASKPDATDHVIDVKRFLARRGNGLFMCAMETLRTVEQLTVANGLPWTPDLKRATLDTIVGRLCESGTSTLFITLDRGGMMDKLTSTGNFEEALEKARQRIEEQAKK